MNGRTLARNLIVALLALIPGADHAAAQWFAETRVGRVEPDFARFVDDADVGLRNVMVGARYEAGPAGVRFSVGLPTGSREPLWGTLGGWRRVTAIRGESWFAGVDVVGSGFLLRDRRAAAGPDGTLEGRSGFGLTGQAVPVAGFQNGRFQLQGRSGLAYYLRRLGADDRRNTVWLSEIRSRVVPVRWFGLGPVLRHYRPSAIDGGHTYAGGEAIVDHGRFSMSVSAGQWIGRTEPGVPWAVGGAIRLHPRVELGVVRRRDAFDPVYLNSAQTSWSVGLSIQLGGTTAQTMALGAVTPGDDGRVTIRLARASFSSPPRIAGDFNQWQPQPMRQAGEYWFFAVDLPPGVYNYAFVDDDGRWFVPESFSARRDDGMGGHVAVLVVP